MPTLLFIAALVLLIIAHEFGHLLAAKFFRVRVDEFGIGFPPRALTLFERAGTLYTLNWLPFGGFVRIFGEDPDEVPEGPERARAFVAQPRGAQALILFAGVFMNALLAWMLFSAVLMVGTPRSAESTPYPLTDERVVVVSVAPDSPAERVGLRAGDTLLSLEAEGKGLEVTAPKQVAAFVALHADAPISVSYARAGAAESVTITPEVLPEVSAAALGVSLDLVGALKLPPLLALYEGGRYTLEALLVITLGLAELIGDAFTLSADISQLSGPIGIVSLAGEAAALGVTPLLTFIAIISLHLVIINLLPIPALDGGRLLFVGIEALRGSPISASVSRLANTAGFFLLLLLMAAITVHDIARLIG